jgi:hypothetical protein
MKTLLKKTFTILLAAVIITACGDDDSTTPIPSAGITGDATVSAFRNTTASLTVTVNAMNGTPTLTANGNEVAINDSTATFNLQIPADDAVGTTYEVAWVLTNGEVSSTFNQEVVLAAGPAVEPNLAPLASIFPEFPGVTIETLISSDDVLDTYNSVGGFQLGGSADGAGMVVNPETGNFELLVNCEDHYSVVRITLDQNLKPLKGDYLLNSSVADFARQCSGTMWESEIHGGSENFFISASETFNYVSKRIDPYQAIPTPDQAINLIGFGAFAWENNVPLPAGSYPGKTVVVGGDDDSSGSEGQLALYYSENGDADVTGGKIYVLKRVGATEVETEADLDFGVAYDVEFVEIPFGSNLSKNEMEDASIAALSLQFMRIEDVDYGKGSDAAGRTVYFAVTGRGPGRGTYNDWGTGYKLVLDNNNPLRGKLTQIVSGNTDTNKQDGNMSNLQSPDNIVVTENYVYWQEDPNSFDRGHQAYIWQTDLNGNGAKVLLQHDINQDLNRDGDTFSGEFGAMFDISDKVGEDGTFILCLQPHYWEDEVYEGIDGHINTRTDNGSREDDQGSQVVILRNVPR